MKLIGVFLFILIGLSLIACGTSRNVSGLVIAPATTVQVATSTATLISVTAIPTKNIAVISTNSEAPISVTQTLEIEQETAMSMTQPLTITIVYDNNQFDQRLKSAWGFSALVEFHDHLLLFDTGGDGYLLMENLRILGIDPERIKSVVLSHAHGDHTGGLSALLSMGSTPTVYLPPSFLASFKHQVEQYTQVVDVFPGQSFAEGLMTTGEIGGPIPEQALVIQTEQGLVIITGCSHPGIVSIIQKVQDLFTGQVVLVLGGFHLGSKPDAEIRAILRDFRNLEVERVAPCHCTGERAIQLFADEYGNDFIKVGVGSVIRLDD